MVYEVLNMDIFLTQTHWFALEDLINPRAAWSTFHDGWMLFLFCLQNLNTHSLPLSNFFFFFFYSFINVLDIFKLHLYLSEKQKTYTPIGWLEDKQIMGNFHFWVNYQFNAHSTDHNTAYQHRPIINMSDKTLYCAYAETRALYKVYNSQSET